MFISPKPHILSVPPCPHGSLEEEERESRGLKRDILDFSVNNNPYGPSPKVLHALSSVDISKYPDSQALGLKRLLSQKLRVEQSQIILGNGSLELLWLLGLAYLSPGDRVLVLGPTFGEYQRASQIYGAEVKVLKAKPEEGFRLSLDRVEKEVSSYSPRFLFLCNPNNPTGLYLAAPEVERLLDACPKTMVVMDEAYIDFVKDAWSSLALLSRGNTFILRSLGKAYGLTGLRVGYGLSSPEVIQSLERVCPPWSVNSVAQAAAMAALQDDNQLKRSLLSLNKAKKYLMREVAEIGYQVYPSAANFFLVKVGNATSFRSRLLEQGFCLRDCASFGLPDFVRIGVRSLPDCRKLVAALRDLALEKGSKP